MSEDQPFFRFHPGAYEAKRTFETSDEPCDACGRPCVWKYTGGVYANAAEPVVCARCIADGSLGRLLGEADYALHDVELEGAAAELEDELLRRTPGVASFNPFPWPVLDGVPLAFIGYGEDEALIALPKVRAAMAEAFAEIGWEAEGPSPYALLFREVAGVRWRAVVDLD